MAANDAPAMALSAAPVHAKLVIVQPSEDELAAHAAMCERIEKESKGRCLWMHLPAAA